MKKYGIPDMTFRKLHRQIAPILLLPLVITALTGMGYRLGRSWFMLPSDLAETFMVIHQGEYLGQSLVPIYVLLVGVGLLGLLATGMVMLRRSPHPFASRKPNLTGRWLHRLIAAIAFLPLCVTAITGIAYRLGQSWFGLSAEQARIFLNIHQGSYLGNALRPFYILLLGLSLLVLLVTGIRMTRIFRQRRSVEP